MLLFVMEFPMAGVLIFIEIKVFAVLIDAFTIIFLSENNYAFCYAIYFINHPDCFFSLWGNIV